jgi:pyruvate-formate lyase-activating enzyme
MASKIDFYPSVKAALDQVGPGMCLAKWNQVTIHLATGHTHSCHHPNTHKIPLEEIYEDPSALHNTKFKKEQRKTMITGGRPEECHYCWNIEDNVPEGVDNVFSDRIIKSTDVYAGKDQYFNVMYAGWEHNIKPRYLEVSFSHACNFKCAYCGPHISSKWMEEIEKFGGYPTTQFYNNLEHTKHQDKMPIPLKEENPYVEAFWKWWPEIYSTLHTFRITGGEPLMSKDTFKVLDYIIENPNPNLELAINSNCVLPDKLFDKFLEKIKIIQENKYVKKFTLFTSAEAYGNKAEYIRHGMDYKIWLSNCHKFLESVPSVNFTVMSTYNALSVTSYIEFLKDILIMKLKFHQEGRSIDLDIPYLDHPRWMSVRILPTSYIEMLKLQVEFMKDNHCNGKGFQNWEIEKLDRIQYLIKGDPEELWLRDFWLFFNEHDSRRNTNFLDTFPELTELYNHCKNLSS